MIRLVLFDIDGTLIRTGGAGMKAFERTFRTEFQIARATDGLNFSGRTDTALVRECLRSRGLPDTPKNFQRFFDTYVFWLHQCLHELRGETCPGVRELIGEFESMTNAPMLGLLTGNIRLGAEIKLRHYALWDHFHSGAFGDDHEDRNQLAVVARDRGRHVLKRELVGDEILVIGDTPQDIECARAINARVLAVGTGAYSCGELARHGPTWLFQSLTSARAADLCDRSSVA